jgi:hypothetical protein
VVDNTKCYFLYRLKSEKEIAEISKQSTLQIAAAEDDNFAQMEESSEESDDDDE